MRLLRFILPALLALIAGACSRVRPELTRADALMEADADSALTLLCAIDTASLTSAERPLYALLLTQAQIKTNATVTSDSLIAQAYRAYRFSPDADLRLRAHFYAAQVARNRNDIRDAMTKLMVAYDMAKNSNDQYWLAKSAEFMAEIFSESYNYEQAKIFITEAAENYHAIDRELNCRYCLCDWAIFNINQGHLDSALCILDSIHGLVVSENPYDADLDNYILRARLGAHMFTADYDSLATLLPEYSYNTSEHEEDLSVTLYRSYIAADHNDQMLLAEEMLHAYGLTADEKEQLRIRYASYRHAIMMHDYARATLLADTIIYQQCKVTENLLNESVTSVQRDYFSSQAIAHKHKSRQLRNIIAFTIVMATVIIAFIIQINRLKLKAKKAETEAHLASIRQLRAECADNRLMMETLFKNGWDMVNKLCSGYYDMGTSDKLTKIRMQDIDTEIEKLRSPQSLLNIEESADRYLGGLITLLRQECAFLKDDDLTFLMLIFAGLAPKSVCVLLNLRKPNFYQKRLRLAKRISESAAPHKAEFAARIANFNN